MAGVMAEPSVQLMRGLEFWRSGQWVDIWAGAQLRAPPAESAASLVRAALLPDTSVNFPVITEICDRIADNPVERGAAVELLGVSLADAYSPYRKKLKALTIANEMMYDPSCVDVFRGINRLHEALGALRMVRDSGLSDHVDENIRMLASEIDKVCFGGEVRARPLDRLGNAVKGNLAKAAGQAAGVLRRENRERSPPKMQPVENTFYYDEEHKRWRQKGVPDEFDNVAPTPAPSPAPAPAPVPALSPPSPVPLVPPAPTALATEALPGVMAQVSTLETSTDPAPFHTGTALPSSAAVPTVAVEMSQPESAFTTTPGNFSVPPKNEEPSWQASPDVAAAFGLDTVATAPVPAVSSTAPFGAVDHSVAAAFGLNTVADVPVPAVSSTAPFGVQDQSTQGNTFDFSAAFNAPNQVPSGETSAQVFAMAGAGGGVASLFGSEVPSAPLTAPATSPSVTSENSFPPSIAQSVPSSGNTGESVFASSTTVGFADSSSPAVSSTAPPSTTVNASASSSKGSDSMEPPKAMALSTPFSSVQTQANVVAAFQPSSNGSSNALALFDALSAASAVPKAEANPPAAFNLPSSGSTTSPSTISTGQSSAPAPFTLPAFSLDLPKPPAFTPLSFEPVGGSSTMTTNGLESSNRSAPPLNFPAPSVPSLPAATANIGPPAGLSSSSQALVQSAPSSGLAALF